MNIVGFGDSYIVVSGKFTNTYENFLAQHFSTKPKFKGIPGSNVWTMFFNFLNYKEPIDVAIFAWTESTRLYHPHAHDINNHSARSKKTEGPLAHVYSAAEQYYKCVLDINQKDWELKALMCLVDEHISKQYPNTKFIHMNCFSMNSHLWFTSKKKINIEDIEYHYKFNNGVELRPSLAYLSQQDDTIDMANDPRPNHLNEHNHRLVANALIKAIEEYKPGQIVNII